MYAGFNDAKRSPVDHSERIAQLEATIARLEARATPQAAAAVDIKQWETNWHKMQLERERSDSKLQEARDSMNKAIADRVGDLLKNSPQKKQGSVDVSISPQRISIKHV